MRLKSKVSALEALLKVNQKEDFIVFTGHSEEDFEKQRTEYLKANPEPGLFIFIRKFTDADFL